MKRIFLAILFLFVAVPLMAETKTLSWDTVTTYTDLTSIVSPALPVTYDAWWSISNTFVTPHNLIGNTTSNSVIFDIVTQGMTRGTTIYFGARARTQIIGEVSADSSPFSWLVPSLVLQSIAIATGPSSVNEGTTGTYTATATWNDNSTTTITPIWSVTPTTYASISSGGVLTTLGVPSNQSVTVNASYTSGGVTKTASQIVTIVNVVKIPVKPTDLTIQ